MFESFFVVLVLFYGILVLQNSAVRTRFDVCNWVNTFDQYC